MLSPALKQILSDHIFKDGRKVEIIWYTMAYNGGHYIYQTEILQFNPRCTKCMSCGGNFVENQRDSSTVTSEHHRVLIRALAPLF